MLRTRQPSAESTTSVSSRLAETAFSNLVEVVATAKHTGQETIPVEVHLLNGVIGEMEDMKEMIASLKNKYMGVKVSDHALCCILLMNSAQVNSIVKA